MNQKTGSEVKNRKELAAHLQSLITSLEDIVFEIDGELTFKNVWTQDESILFMPKKEFLGKKVKDVMGPQSNLFTDPIKEVIKTGEAREIVYHHFDPSLNQWFKARIRPVVKAAVLADYILVLSIQDITQQKLAELILQETKERLEASNQLLDVSQELSQTAGWEFKLKTGDIFWTRQVYLLFDENEDFHPSFNNTQSFFKDKERMDQHINEAIHQKRPFDLELEITTAKGINKWVRAIGRPVIKDGEVVMLRGALMDITLKKESELELIKARNEAESASQSKSDFLSVMSHEIRTPLNGIIGIANLLKLSHTADQKEYISNLIFSAGHLMQLINDILDLTKIDNDKLELLFANVNLLELVMNIKNQFKSQAEAKGILLKSFIADEIPQMVIVDPIRLGQILNNLIGNAIKFTDKGEVTLLIKLIAKEENKASIHFSIKDTGMGIPQALQATIFESFKQVQQSPFRKHSGTGLGLTITRKLVELHNSQIYVRSEPGVGAEFYFDLTFELAADQHKPVWCQISSQLVGSGRKLTGLRVLIVEDNPVNMMVARKQLEYFGIYADCAPGGDEALEYLKHNLYDVAMVDLHMPGMDGYALAEIICKQYPGIHVVIFTADIMTDVKVKFARINIHDILNKPFLPDKMFEVLYRVAKARGLVTD